MSKTKDRVEGFSTVTAKERRTGTGYGRRAKDLTADDIEMLGKLETSIEEYTANLEQAWQRMERNQEEFDRLKSESGVMIDDTEQIISTFQPG